ncbi:peptide deformylase [Spirillospora sp. CA-142024]|uniref:peptide deformylase n=1 Tax=Spirillospora sp. CA-142024 TaxID=3240036 RepID=UPI003D8D5DBA
MEVARTRLDGRQVAIVLNAALAHLAGHEIDHLYGRLYIDRMREGTRSPLRSTGVPAKPGPTEAGCSSSEDGTMSTRPWSHRSSRKPPRRLRPWSPAAPAPNAKPAAPSTHTRSRKPLVSGGGSGI